MRARPGEYRLQATWLPVAFDAGGGRIQYGISPFIPEDGTGRPPPTVSRLGVTAGTAVRPARAERPAIRVLFTLDFFGPDIHQQRIRVLATPEEPGRFEQYQLPWWPHVVLGGRDVAVAVHLEEVDAPGSVGRQALWIERGAEISVTARGITETELHQFIVGLQPTR